MSGVIKDKAQVSVQQLFLKVNFSVEGGIIFNVTFIVYKEIVTPWLLISYTMATHSTH